MQSLTTGADETYMIAAMDRSQTDRKTKHNLVPALLLQAGLVCISSHGGIGVGRTNQQWPAFTTYPQVLCASNAV